MAKNATANAKPKRRPKPKINRSDPAQSERFIEAARKAGCSEDEAVFDENLKKIARHKPPAASAPPPRQSRKKE
jgi:hypothetical protein